MKRNPLAPCTTSWVRCRNKSLVAWWALGHVGPGLQPYTTVPWMSTSRSLKLAVWTLPKPYSSLGQCIWSRWHGKSLNCITPLQTPVVRLRARSGTAAPGNKRRQRCSCLAILWRAPQDAAIPGAARWVSATQVIPRGTSNGCCYLLRTPVGLVRLMARDGPGFKASPQGTNIGLNGQPINPST